MYKLPKRADGRQLVVIATILCDRKAGSQMVAIPPASQIEAPEGFALHYYVNIETKQPALFQRLSRWLPHDCQIPYSLDSWSVNSDWEPIPQYDQDQARLIGIERARNMARQFAMHQNASWLLFIDADVIPPADTLKKLLPLGKAISGGLVPGRGAHSHVHYAFHRFEYLDEGPVLATGHGTFGCCLLRRDLFSTLSFRSGVSRDDMRTALSEDPAYASDAYLNGFGRWYIHTEVVCQHRDDPAAPLTREQVSQNGTIPI